MRFSENIGWATQGLLWSHFPKIFSSSIVLSIHPFVLLIIAQVLWDRRKYFLPSRGSQEFRNVMFQQFLAGRPLFCSFFGKNVTL
jgi:hypothetical protein